ncbi:hypothetical protein Pmani_004167 [Petrolisthes manimaculis]|uniref:Endonuclease/exonuclease/phosphatase domain-containing protein n=1 Tax=Petrolisthes manimaculis TaxID=1843537 RepID=A0AAE1QH39_9EUCA|nr:hypothetical protein Pmani_004167 [Petrolisthes manimaculis]
MYVKKDLRFNELSMKQQYCENICVHVKVGKESLILASIYRSPANNSSDNDKLLNLIDEICHEKAQHKIICGDFNFPNINWDSYTTTQGRNNIEFNFIEKKRDNFLSQQVKGITRHRGEARGNTLDLIFTNQEEIIENVKIDSPVGRSDHAVFCFNVNLETEKNNRKKRVFIYEKANYDLMRQKLDIDWTEYLEEGDMESKWNKFKTKLEEVISECVPVKVIRCCENRKRRTNEKLPMNRKLWTMIKKKNRLWEWLKNMRLQKESNDLALQKHAMEYRRTNNKVRSETRKEIKNKEKVIAENVKDNRKVFWDYVQKKLKRKVGIPVLQVTENGHTTTAESDKKKG